MMQVQELLSPADVLALPATSKRELLRIMADHAAARLGLDAVEISNALAQREALGSTGIGGGVALPHARLAAVSRAHGVFATLAKPVEYGAVDDRPVDLVFLLLLPTAPSDIGVRALACVARRFRQAGLVYKLRAASDPRTIYDRFVEP